MKISNSVLEILNDLSENIESTDKIPYEMIVKERKRFLNARKKKIWYEKNAKTIDESIFDESIFDISI